MDKITLLTVIQDKLHAISGTGKLTLHDGKVPTDKKALLGLSCKLLPILLIFYLLGAVGTR